MMRWRRGMRKTPARATGDHRFGVAAYLHPTSTVPMGADSDPTAVVEPWGKVRGVEVGVVDA
jgi:choline dehydrogenase-like flavoprotein